MEHYDLAGWQPYLLVAELGAVSIGLGIAFLAIQLIASIRKRARLRAGPDPWDGRTLEWSISSPPPHYNFAVIPRVHGIDAFWAMKKGAANEKPARLHDIIMPENSSAGLFLGALSFVFGFAMIWYIWWLAGAAGIAMWIPLLARSFGEDPGHRIPASKIEKTESRRAPLPAGAS
jgi:cytochrome o ubiquinol oxidase subunit 1